MESASFEFNGEKIFLSGRNHGRMGQLVREGYTGGYPSAFTVTVQLHSLLTDTW